MSIFNFFSRKARVAKTAPVPPPACVDCRLHQVVGARHNGRY